MAASQERRRSGTAPTQEQLRSDHIQLLQQMQALSKENEALKKRLAAKEGGGASCGGASSGAAYEQLEASHAAELMEQVEKTEALQRELQGND